MLSAQSCELCQHFGLGDFDSNCFVCHDGDFEFPTEWELGKEPSCPYCKMVVDIYNAFEGPIDFSNLRLRLTSVSWYTHGPVCEMTISRHFQRLDVKESLPFKSKFFVTIQEEVTHALSVIKTTMG